mmetsp:Transcript_25149/g.35238  ORF Transcript_25149/g.35238 Transcript_25149/m.35238 type:complete len:208 (-) Transcript_25149:533-1156(-)
MLQHFIDISLQQSMFLQLLADDFVSFGMHIKPINSRFQRFDHSLLCGQHSFVDLFLFFCELATHWKRSCDVTTITMVFSTHVKRYNFPISDFLRIGSSSVPVVKNRTVLSACANTGVAHVSTTSMEVCVVLKNRFHLVLHQSRTNTLHDFNVGFAANIIYVSHQFQFQRCLNHSAFTDFRKEKFRIYGICVNIIKCCWFMSFIAISV